MRIARTPAALAVVVLMPLSGSALAGCKLFKVAEMAVSMAGRSPVTDARINGRDVRFLVDSGMDYSMITPASARALGLQLYPAPSYLRKMGVGGVAEISVAKVGEFVVASSTIANIEFEVGGNELGAGISGMLGQNVLGSTDVEYDLAGGAVRLMRPGDGCGQTPLAYWAGSQHVSAIDLDWSAGRRTHTLSVITINGQKVHVAFDTGANTSYLSLKAAERLGIRPGDPGVVSGGLSRGIGRKAVETWIAPIANVRIGDEEISNTHIRIGEMSLESMEMLIGADFFLSHHVYVANSRDKLYFTYNGGPVFNLERRSSSTDAAPPAAPDLPPIDQTPPADAAGYRHRAAAYAARGDFERAVADLTRACELAPESAVAYYERGAAYRASGRNALAQADFDAALQRDAEFPEALIARATLRTGDSPRTLAEIAIADRVAAKEADVRLSMGNILLQEEQLAGAIAQYDLWIGAHEGDGRMAEALRARCWARTLAGTELDQALDDCNAALDISNGSAPYYGGRALVLLRTGKFTAAIDDFDAALDRDPKESWSLYGRGLARLHVGRAEQGRADIAAAVALQPGIAEQARKSGLAP